jgi:16S rRNA (adenine1518-N6/adenine1519-N6)-dimethyltransferase
LAKKVKKVIAVEKDKRMAEILKNVLADKNIQNVEIIESDILKIENFPFSCHSREACPRPRSGSGNLQKNADESRIKCGMTGYNYKIVANIPYYLTSPLIRKFLEADNQPESMILMIQKEVAQRICAKPPKMTLLSVAAQFYAEPKIISYVSKNSFWPKPKVDSAIIKIIPMATPPFLPPLSRGGSRGGELHVNEFSRDHFFKITKAGFSQPRKQLINNLSKGLKISREKTSQILNQAGILPTQRPGELSVEKWLDLAWIICGENDIISISKIQNTKPNKT